LFGEVVDGKMVLNDAGRMVEQIWNLTIDQCPNIQIGEYMIMPNHFHCIIEIPVGAESISAQNMESRRADIESARTGEIGMIPRIVQSFKRHSTIKYIEMVKLGILPRFIKRVWQRNYWEHIVRNENELLRISEYIRNNPKKWTDDKLNGGVGNSVMEDCEPYNEETWMV